MRTDLIAQDRNFLHSFVKGDAVIPNMIKPSEVAIALMPNLRTTDPELRDELSYSALAKILQTGELSSADMEHLLRLAKSEDYLLAGIGEVETDTVFGRSFATLIIAAIIEVDIECGLLSPLIIHETTRAMLNYAQAERDHRGFVDGKGWAHSVAHTADALDSCAHHPVTTLDERIEILEVIMELATMSEPLTYLEDDRLAYPVLRMIKSEQISVDYVQTWVRKFDTSNFSSKEGMLRSSNMQHFLRSLHGLILWECSDCPLLDTISAQLKSLNVFYRYGLL